MDGGLDGAVASGSTLDGSSAGDGSQFGLDGSVGFTLPDGRVVGPGSDDDGGAEPEIDVATCGVADDQSYEFSVPFVEGGFALAAGALDFGLAYYRMAECKHAIDTAVVDSTSGAPVPATIVDDCKTINELSLGTSPNGFHLAYTDNTTGSIELHALALGDDLRPAASALPEQLTDNDRFERRPVVAGVGQHALAAWFEENGDARRILTRVLDMQDAAVEVVKEADGHLPIELALSQVGSENAALAWVEEVQNRGIWLQPLEPLGVAVGEPLQLTDFAAPGSTVDVALREEDGGAAVYSVGVDLVNFEVRFRRLNRDASLRGEEIKVISRPLQGKDAGIARLGGGYAVVYRAIPDGGTIVEPQIRLAFVTKEGNVTRDAVGRLVTHAIAPAARDGSRIQVKLSTDGQLLIAFVDGNDAGENRLRVIRRRLDCAG